MNCRTLLLAIIATLALVPAHADTDDLSGGVLLVHAPPGIVYSSGMTTWCDSTKLEDCEDQVTRIDGEGPHVWFVLSAWAEEKSFSAVEFGLGDFDSESFGFTGYGICLDDAMALYHPSVNDWPGPNTGIAIAASGDAWTGQLVPIYWFAGLNYAEADTIAITKNPATDHAGWLSAGSGDTYDPECTGALGLQVAGTPCSLSRGPASEDRDSPSGAFLATCLPDTFYTREPVYLYGERFDPPHDITWVDHILYCHRVQVVPRIRTPSPPPSSLDSVLFQLDCRAADASAAARRASRTSREAMEDARRVYASSPLVECAWFDSDGQLLVTYKASGHTVQVRERESLQEEATPPDPYADARSVFQLLRDAFRWNRRAFIGDDYTGVISRTTLVDAQIDAYRRGIVVDGPLSEEIMQDVIAKEVR